MNLVVVTVRGNLSVAALKITLCLKLSEFVIRITKNILTYCHQYSLNNGA